MSIIPTLFPLKIILVAVALVAAYVILRNPARQIVAGVADTANAFSAFGFSDQDDSKTARELSQEEANAIIDAAGYNPTDFRHSNPDLYNKVFNDIYDTYQTEPNDPLGRINGQTYDEYLNDAGVDQPPATSPSWLDTLINYVTQNPVQTAHAETEPETQTQTYDDRNHVNDTYNEINDNQIVIPSFFSTFYTRPPVANDAYIDQAPSGVQPDGNSRGAIEFDDDGYGRAVYDSPNTFVAQNDAPRRASRYNQPVKQDRHADARQQAQDIRRREVAALDSKNARESSNITKRSYAKPTKATDDDRKRAAERAQETADRLYSSGRNRRY